MEKNYIKKKLYKKKIIQKRDYMQNFIKKKLYREKIIQKKDYIKKDYIEKKLY